MNKIESYQFNSVQSLSNAQLFATPWTEACQGFLSITNSWSHPNPCPLSQWCHPTISSSVIPFSFFPQSVPALGSFQMIQLFTSDGQSIGVSASASVLSLMSGSRQRWLHHSDTPTQNSDLGERKDGEAIGIDNTE